MIPASTLYDEYINRPKLTEQKNPVEYIVPPPSRGVGTKMNAITDISIHQMILLNFIQKKIEVLIWTEGFLAFDTTKFHTNFCDYCAQMPLFAVVFVSSVDCHNT